jgi:hypothetical protein
MAAPKAGRKVAQAWIELKADDPEAVSALSVARAQLSAGRALAGLRRMRLLELKGALPARTALEDLLHRSTWFYNPHKERCIVRMGARDPSPAAAGERVVLVTERGAERRPEAERWWLHETGQPLEAREGIAYLLKFERGADDEARVAELALLTGRRQGLLCNPNSQDCAWAAGEIPLPWIDDSASQDAAPKKGTP